jgi:RimJ/RimL family protein N-acetyltransferase
MSTVQLNFYQPEHRAVLEAFYLPEEQEKFTGMPNKVLELAIEDKHRYPIVILAQSKPVGFFILYDGDDRKSYTRNRNSLLLRAFSVNYAEQGNGYAKQALLQLQDFVKVNFPFIEEIVLAVNEQNVPAKNLYLKCGFHDTGQKKFGYIGPQHILAFNPNNIYRRA